MPTFLDGLAEFERELIRARTGRKRTKAKSVKFGRSAALTPHQRQEVIQRLRKALGRPISPDPMALSQATISRLAAA